MDDVIRIRVTSVRYNLSVTAHVVGAAFWMRDPEEVAHELSSEIFPLTFSHGTVPTFHVTITNHPQDPELVLRTIAAHLEAFYDAVFT